MSSYEPYSCYDTAKDEIIAAVVFKFSATLSIYGSVSIILDVIKRMRSGIRNDSYQRIMLGLSFFDIILSFFFPVVGASMTPSETGWLMAMGNETSCFLQGFFILLGGFGSFGYQMALSFNVLLLISFRWSQRKFARIAEKPMHFLIIVSSVAAAAVPWAMKTTHPFCGRCTDSNTTYLKLFVSLYLIMISFCTIAMAWVYCSVWRQEVRMKRYRQRYRLSDVDHHRDSKRIRKVLLLYTLSLYFCWGFYLLRNIFTAILGKAVPFAVTVLFDSLFPLLGFLNMAVYFMPKAQRYQEENPPLSLFKAYYFVLIPSIRLNCCKRRSSEEAATEEESDGVPEIISDGADMNFIEFNAGTMDDGAFMSSAFESEVDNGGDN
mmetsp:Transcript_11394/g.14413  ORF Transcript_11394/g.14413 Transcript_11394/m.14413 type:complete len:378 (-) Transcript_11394:78-1211(-)